MEYVILGLLAIRAMTVYEINKALQKSISLFYSASFGSIHSAIDRMILNGWILAEERIENGRNKKMYHLTPGGQEALQHWLQSEIEAEKVKDPALTRLFFMGMLPIDQRIALLESHIQTLHQTHAILHSLQEQSGGVKVPQEHGDIYACQLLTLQYGLDFYSFNIAWYQNLLDDWKKKR